MKPTVIFVCVKNGGKSQIAAALMRQRAGDAVRVYSAGTHPGSKLNAEAQANVEKVGASFAGEYPKALDPDLARQASHIIIVGSEAHLDAEYPASVRTWDIDEPSLRGVEGEARMDDLRIQLERLVDELYQELQGN